jgi:hypothetical protein
VNPLFAYFSMFAPVMFFVAGSPIRKELEPLVARASTPRIADFVVHHQHAMRRFLSFASDSPARPTP